MSSKFSPSMDKVMTTEQFTQVVDAILQGKYSWACVLILRFAGYNPLHYIPYRTYNRLTKENSLRCCEESAVGMQRKMATHNASPQSRERIQDLNYLEPLREQPVNVRGGRGIFIHSYLLIQDLISSN